jgi:hypothetical protein
MKNVFLWIACLLPSFAIWGQAPENHFQSSGARNTCAAFQPSYLHSQRMQMGAPGNATALNWVPGVEPPDIIAENPGWDLEYRWDSTIGTWRLIKGRTYTYDSQGKVVERRSDDYLNGQPSPFLKHIYSYDAQGRLARRSTYYWSSGAWLLSNRVSQRLDAHGNRTSQLGQQLFSSTWDTVYADSTRYTYVLGNRIASKEFSLWDDNTRQLANQSLETWTYDTDSLELTHIRSHWAASQWNKEMKEEQIYSVGGVKLQTNFYNGFQNHWNIWQTYRWLGWHDQHRILPTAYELDEYSADSIPTLQHQSRANLQYGQYDSRTALIEAYDGQQWTPAITWSQVRDAMNHSTDFRLFFYNGIDTIFVVSVRDHYTYDAQQHVIEEVHEQASMDSTVYLQLSRLEHGNFFITAIDAQAALPPLKAFPIPCNHEMKLALPMMPMEPVSIEIYDLSGKLRLQSINPATQEVTIPISEALENGCYIYRLRCGEYIAQGKLEVVH